MKLILCTLLSALSLMLTSCLDSHASPSPAKPAPENGARFKEGKGVALTEQMRRSIELQTTEVTEERIAPSFTIPLQVMQRGREAGGWLTGSQAERVRPGMEIMLGAVKASVLRLEKAPFITLGDFEVTVQCAATLEAGSTQEATFHFEAGEAVTAIPTSALLTTAEGTFVYAKNDEFFLRTPVKTGTRSGDHVEITDGLYSGDEIVTTPVMSLWLAELQVLRGGKACTCGH